MTIAADFVAAFERSYPNVRFTPEEREELIRLFRVCKENSKGREIWAEEAEVIECAQDLCNLWEGAHYVPIGRQVKKAEGALLDAMGALLAQCDGQWKAP